MGVDRHRDLDAVVARYGLDDVRRHTGVQEQRHAGVPQVVEPDRRQAGALPERAWSQQDPDLIVTIFTKHATYHERVLQAASPSSEFAELRLIRYRSRSDDP
jgi:hypothetical protein